MRIMPEQEAEIYQTLLLEYACGALDPDLSLLMAAHLTLSPPARRSVALYECLGGALIEESCAPVAMGSASLGAVLAQLDCPEAAARCNPPASYVEPPEGIPLPQPLCRFLDTGRRRGAAGWRRIYPGIDVISVTSGARRHEVRLYRFGPGRKAPRHQHDGMELTLVIDGSLRAGAETYRRGDLLIINPHAAHSPRASEDEGCLCLVATPGHTGWIGLIEKLLGI